MKCLRCEQLDFSLIKPNISGYAYVECSHCGQGHLILKKLALRLAEVIGDVPPNLGNSVVLTCGKCSALRFIAQSASDRVKSTQICNLCIKEAENTSDSVMITKEAKISWEEFLTKTEKLN